jgi:tetratricopeptide (TPR) repeat protein
MGAAAGAAAGIAIWLFSGRTPGPLLHEPPSVNLAGADPAVIEAVGAATARVRAAPGDAGAWGDLGMTLLAHDFHGPAAAALEQAAFRATAEPRWPYLQAAALSLGDADPRAALRAFARAAAFPGAAPVARVRFAEALLAEGEIDRARAELERALAADPKDPRIRAGLGRAALQRGDLEGARRELAASSAAAPGVRATRLLHAEVLSRLGNRAAADAERRAAAALPEKHVWPDPYWSQVVERWVGALALIERAADLTRSGRGPEAVRLLAETATRYPSVLLVHLSLGRLLLQAGDAAGAEGALRRAAEFAPDSFEAHFELAGALLAGGKTGDGVLALEKTLALKPDYPPAHYQLGRARLQQGNQAGAIESLRAAVRYRPSYGAAHRDLGALLLAAGAREEGIQSLRTALDLNPADAEARRLIETAGVR